MNKYIIFTDLDGTISFQIENEDGSKTSYTNDFDIQALHDLRAQGHILSVATGRDIPGIQTFLQLADFSFDYYIGGNGSITTDKDFNIVHQHAFTNEATQQLTDYLLTTFPDFYITGYDGFKTYAINHKGEHPLFTVDPANFVFTSAAELAANPVTFVAMDMFPKTGSYADMTKQAQAAIEVITPQYADTVNFFRNQYYIDFAPLGISKGSAVTNLTKNLENQAVTIITVGDSWNDTSMFAVADRSFTFHHADTELHAHADDVVENFAEMAKNLLDI